MMKRRIVKKGKGTLASQQVESQMMGEILIRKQTLSLLRARDRVN
jgi:hypothetical protein